MAANLRKSRLQSARKTAMSHLYKARHTRKLFLRSGMTPFDSSQACFGLKYTDDECYVKQILRGHHSGKKLVLVDSLILENVIFLRLVTLAYSSVKFLNCVLINVRIRELILFLSV